MVATDRSNCFASTAASKHSTCTRVQMISDDGHHASARTVCVVRVVPMADSWTERPCVLLTASAFIDKARLTFDA